MILSLCDDGDLLSALRIFRIIIILIKIVVPIILIVSSMLNYMTAVSSHDDALSRANKNLIPKLIAAILVFFIPTFVGLIADATSYENDNYISCIKNSTQENINKAYYSAAKKRISIASDQLSEAEYSAAKTEIYKVKDEAQRQALLKELETTKQYIDIKKEILKLQNNYNAEDYKKVQEKINSISDAKVKEKLLAEFKKIIKPVEGNPNGIQGRSSTMTYVVHTPKLVASGMPLILYLHGDGGGNSSGSSPFLNAAKKYFGEDLPFILVTPNGGMWAETNGRLAELKSIIDTECEKYKCNTQKIGISGHSRGSIGTWHMINNYPGFFYSAVPVSCGSYSINYSNFVKTKIRAYAGTSGSAEQRYNSEMNRNVNGIKNAGGNAVFISLPGATHGTAPGQAYTKDTLLWMIN